MRTWGGTKSGVALKKQKKKRKDFISSWEFSCLMLPGGNPAARTRAFLRPRRSFPQPCTCSRSGFSPQTFFHLLVPSGVSIKRPGTEQTNTSCGTLAADTNIDVGYEALRGGGGGEVNTQHLPRTSGASFPPAVVHLPACWGLVKASQVGRTGNKLLSLTS